MSVQDCCFNVEEGAPKACWVLTNSCNLACDYCAAKSSRVLTRTLSVKKSIRKRVVETCDNVGIHKVILSGGEPLIFRDIADVVGYLTGNGLRVSVCTNGTLLSTQLLSDLRMAGLAKLVIGIDVSKTITGVSCYDTSYAARIIHILNIVERSNTPYELNVVFLPIDESETNKLASWLKALRPTSVNLIEPQTCGRLAIPNGEIPSTWDQQRMEEAAANLMDLIEPVNSVFVSPRCRDHDCPSERLVFGITSYGALDQCPWKHHLNVTSPEESAHSQSLTTICAR